MAEQQSSRPQDVRKSYVIRKDRMEIIALTDFFRTEGTAHFIPRARMSDFMNRPDINFIPLTDAIVYSKDDGTTIFKTSFLCLNKADVTILTLKGELADE